MKLKDMRIQNTLWIALFTFLSVGLFAQKDCQEKVADLKDSDIKMLDTIKALPNDSDVWVNKVMKVYRPGEHVIEQTQWEGDLKVYYFRKDNCLLIHRTEKYLKLEE